MPCSSCICLQYNIYNRERERKRDREFNGYVFVNVNKFSFVWNRECIKERKEEK